MVKQAYKLELLTKWMIYNVFYVLLLEQDIIKKEWVNEKTLPKLEKKFEAGDSKEYKIKTIIDSTIYGKKTNS